MKWIIGCTKTMADLHICGYADNEIDLVRIAEAHINYFEKSHREYMFASAVSPEQIENIKRITGRNENFISFKDLEELGFDLEKNLYRPNTANKNFTLPVGEVDANY